jgi:hypothetical protein
VGHSLSLTEGTETFRLAGPRPASRRPAGIAAVVVLAALPMLVFGVPALLGHPVWPGDDLTQNFPLRVLAGQQIRSGRLPLFDPYLWSGSPLLAGWNAAAAYPLTWLFAVLPGTAAWTLNLVVTWAVAGLGMFAFLRALRLGMLASLLGALSFAFAGAMTAQVGHFGLVAGLSWVPLELLAVLRLAQARSAAARLRWTGILAAAFGLTILAGEPRAIDDAGVIVAVYAAWQSARLGRRWLPAAGSAAAGLLLGVCLGAVQWLPGLAAVATSQRGATSLALFESGSLYPKWLLLMLVPDLLGGSGSLGQPAFSGPYNLAEVTGYIGVFPLVAAAALTCRLRLRPRPPEWAVWYLLALAGVLLALGGRTPLGHLLVHVPFFGSQRLQSRNILVTDLALAVLLGYWADQPFPGRARLRLRGGGRAALEAAVAALPPLAMIAVVAAGCGWGGGLLRWLGVNPAAAGHAGRLLPWLVPYAVIGTGALVFVLAGRRLPARLRAGWLAGFVAADLVIFIVLAVVAVPLPGSSTASHVTALTGRATRTRRAAGARPVARLGYRGRFAIYDPGQSDSGELRQLAAPDLNVISGTASVQGYSSIVDGAYASATGSHRAMGEGQDVLSPRAIGNGTLDQLGTSILLTLPRYLITGGSARPGGPPGAGQRSVPAHHQATWYFGTQLRVSALTLPDRDASRHAAAGARLGVITPAGQVHWLTAVTAAGSALAVRLAYPVTAVGVIALAGRQAGRLGPPAVTGPGGRRFAAGGPLQTALTPPRWRYAGHDGPFAIFADRFARGPLTLQPLPGRTAAGASVRLVAGPAADPAAAAVRSPHGIRVIRSVAALPGWSATWQPRHGRTAILPVRRAGLVQAVAVPPGRGVLTWSYTPPGFPAALVLSVLAALVTLGLLTIQPAAGAAGAARQLSGGGRESNPPATRSAAHRF